MIFWSITILGIYLALILAIGFFSGRGAGKDTESFFVAGRHLNWLQESMAVFTTLAPAGALMGTIGLFYKNGANMLAYVIGYSFLMPLTYWYVGSRLRRLGRALGYQTQAVFVGDFYQSRFLHWGVAICGIAFTFPHLIADPVAMGILLHASIGVSYPMGLLIFVLVAAVYTLKGGLKAVANTDVFHGALMLIFMLVVVPILVMHAGGLHKVLDTPALTVSSSGPGLMFFLCWLPYMGVTTITMPDRAFRMFAVRDENNMRKGVMISGAMLALSSTCYLLIGLSVRQILPHITNTDTTLVRGLEVSAVWLVPWFVMNACGGGMSAYTAGMLSAANIFIKDIFEQWFVRRSKLAPGPQRTKLLMYWTRGFIVLLALATLSCCFFPPFFIWDLINLSHGALLQFVPMLMLGFLWRGITRLGIQVGWVVGVGLQFVWTFFAKPPVGPLAGVDALAVNLVLVIIVSLLVGEKKELKEAREAMRVLASQDADTVAADEVTLPKPVLTV